MTDRQKVYTEVLRTLKDLLRGQKTRACGHLGHDDHRHRDEQEGAIERDEFRSASLGQSRQCGKANASLCEESTG